jgi:hypothetical protein
LSVCVVQLVQLAPQALLTVQATQALPAQWLPPLHGAVLMVQVPALGVRHEKVVSVLPPQLSAVLHDELQQTVSTQKLLAQSPALPHGWPFLSLHTPAPSQVLVAAGQLSGSSAFLTAEQVPEPFRLQAEQVPHAPMLQHTESTQLPLVHWSGAAQP